ncbi:MAG TPA: transglycosylase SLT domain-containing protein [Bacillota bacterium]|nr:transglycosylase SLT domain-containing protein [Bacillota bacterium]
MNKAQKESERITFGLIFIILIIFMVVFMHMKQKDIQTLKQENNQLKLEKNSLEFELDVALVNGLNFTDNSYYRWSSLEETADTLVEDSNGQFKKPWALYLVNESYQFDIDPYIPYELLKTETGGTFDPQLIGPKTKYGHAYGLGQFMKNTAPWIADMSNVAYEDDLLFDPYYSIHLTCVYLDFLYSQYENWDKTLTAYHRGIGGLESYIERNGHAKSKYATEILEASQKN